MKEDGKIFYYNIIQKILKYSNILFYRHATRRICLSTQARKSFLRVNQNGILISELIVEHDIHCLYEGVATIPSLVAIPNIICWSLANRTTRLPRVFRGEAMHALYTAIAAT
jgi:hypothetical protein